VLAGVTHAVPSAPPAVPGPTAEYRAHATRTQAHKLASVKGELELGPEHSSYSAYLQGEAVVYIDERVTTADHRTRHRRYYFDNGAIYYYEAELAAHAVGGGASATGPSVPVQVEWNGMGQAVKAVRMEHYGPVKLDPPSITAITTRAGLLFKLATQQWHASH
jgi:hypothetical protein